MSYIDDLLKDFTKENVVKWLKDGLKFFNSPKSFVSTTAMLPADKLIPQFLFYFIFYTLGFFILLIGNDPLSALRPALLNLVNVILMIGLFSILTYMFTSRNLTKEITIFILSAILFSSPVILLLQSQFLNTDNFSYKFGAGVVNAIVQVISFVLFPFFISLGRKLAWRTAVLVFLILNITWVFFSNFSFDEYEKKLNMYNLDPVISEYNETFEELSFKEDIPTYRVFYWNDNGRQSGFWIQDITSPEKPISESTEGNTVYIKSIKDNLDLLNKRISHAKFQRNKEMFLAWKDYFQNVQPLCNVNEFSGTDVKMLLRDYQIGVDSINGHPRTFIKIDINPVVKVQANLKMRHNATVNAFDYSEFPVIVANRIRYFLGYVIDGVYVDYLQKPKSKPYTDRFNPITSGF